MIDDLSSPAFADAIARVVSRRFDAAVVRSHAERFGRERFGDEIEAVVRESARGRTPVIRHNRLLVAFHVVSDALLGLSAFIAAYALRFQLGLFPVPKGLPPLRQYINVLPFIRVVVPVGFFLQGLYRLRRGRSRVDDFFAVFVGSILAVVFGIVATLVRRNVLSPPTCKASGAFEVSQVRRGRCSWC